MTIEKEEMKEQILKGLIQVVNAFEGGNELISNQGQALDETSALYNFIDLAKKAKELYS